MSSSVMAVVMVNYGSHQMIDASLDAAIDEAPGYSIIVVDNYHSAAERRAIQQLTSRRGWCLVSQPENSGFGRAVNEGVNAAEESGATSVLLLNPDAVITLETLASLKAHVADHPMDMVSPKLLRSSGDVYFDGTAIDLTTGDGPRPGATGIRNVPWLSGTCLAVSLRLFRLANGMSEAYFLYWEDVDLSFRVREAGGSLVVRHDLTAVHDESGTQGVRAGRAKSNTYYYYNCRNRLVFGAMHLTKRQLLTWIIRTPAASWHILLRGGRRQLLHSLRPLQAVVKGTLAGTYLAVRIASGAKAPSSRTGSAL